VVPAVMTWRETVATLRADFAINEFAEPRVTLAVWRLGQAAHGRPGAVGFVVRRVHGVLDQLWTRSVIGAELPRSVPAGPGLRLPHAGRGVVLHSATRLGSRITLYHQVTLGVRHSGIPPVVGDDVLLGVGARVLGPVHLGDGCSVGANAVVLHDIPAGQSWVGVPAHPIVPAPIDDGVTPVGTV
jgi:serine O-acetyltransferase